MLQNPNIIFKSQHRIIILNTQGLRFASQTTPCWSFLNFIQFVYSIMNVISLFRSTSTFGTLWEWKISSKIGHRRDMETNVNNGPFAMSSGFFKIWTRSSQRIWKTRLKTLCIIFESPFGIIIPKIPNLCFAYQATHLRFSPSYMHLFQYDNEYNFLI